MTTPRQASAPAAAAGTFPTRHGLDADARAAMIALLNAHLADTLDLHTQTKQAHWNVKGKDFYQLHELFDDLAANIAGHADTLAERATALGGTATGTVRMAAAASRVPEFPTTPPDGRAYLVALADRYAGHGNRLREGVEEAEAHGDKATADLLTEMVQDVDKALYFLESHLQA